LPVRLIRGDQPLPDPEQSDARGLVAIGGDLRTGRLLDAYRRGIFPWYGEGLPILWHSPDPRFVLEPAALRVNRSLRKSLRRHRYRLSFDTAFDQVIRRCAEVPRHDQDGTWITSEMMASYEQLFELGHAHSVEAWDGEQLVGGVYGVVVGAVAPDASKIAFVRLVEQLERWGFELIDCQVHTDHLEHFGGVEWPRARFLAALERLRECQVAPVGAWVYEVQAGDQG
jgi:leucyl/phenylalanyl-tRNA--protein transferase